MVAGTIYIQYLVSRIKEKYLMANKDDCPQELCSDESLPISFNKKRHTTVATVNNTISKSWRIRDRVSNKSTKYVQKLIGLKNVCR